MPVSLARVGAFPVTHDRRTGDLLDGHFGEAAKRELSPWCPENLNTGGSWGEDPLGCAPTVLYWTVGVRLHADAGGGERELRENSVLLRVRLDNGAVPQKVASAEDKALAPGPFPTTQAQRETRA